jgi:Tfp pilus assembly protein PilE
MKTVSCPRCNLVTWTTAVSCKRCDFVFVKGKELSAQDSPSQTVAQMPSAKTHFRELSPQQAHQPQQQFVTDIAEPVQSISAPQYQQDWSQQNYSEQQTRYRNYQNYRPANLKKKIGLAVTSMILGIIGFPPLSVFLGVLFSVILGAVLGTTGFVVGAALTLAVIPSGLITGIVALRRANNRSREYGGKGFAIAGIACSSVGLLILPMVAVIAVPNLTASRRAANESSAVSTMQKLAEAEEKYMNSMSGRCGDAQTLFASRLIDAESAKGEKNGYRFMIINLPRGGCEIHGVPLSSSHGSRSFYYTTEDKLIRAAKKDGKLAGKDDRLLGSDEDDLVDKKNDTKNSKPDENAAVSALRTLHGAQMTYMTTAGNGKTGDLQTLANQGLIKQSLADGEEQGYRFVFNKLPSNNWEVTATPLSDSSNARSFYINQEGVIRGAMKNGLAAGKGDPALEL